MPNASVSVEVKDITLSGKKVRIRTGGTGRPLLLLHSAWGDAELSWASVWNDLSSSFEVIAPDLPGFGSSDPLDRPSLATHARALNDLLDVQRAGPAIVVGNSFGVSVALEFASLFPDRTLRVVVVNGGYLPLLPKFARRFISLSPVEKHFRSFIRNFNYSDKAFAKAFPDHSKLPPKFFETIRKNEESQSRVVFDTFMAQRAPQLRPTPPASMVWGTGDRLITMKQAEIIRTWLGNPGFVPIDGAGHMPQVERPSVFVDAIRKIRS